MFATELRRLAVPAIDPTKAGSVGTSDSLGEQESHLSWKQVIGSAEPFLEAVARRLADQIGEFDPEIASYAQYALTNQGKQLRPALVALSAGAAGRVNESHVLVAVVIEMVHLATLVHDDVMDEATIRRGRPTLAAHWGNEISVLLGDCLFAHALKLAASFPTTEICRAVSAATNTVCSGEILQTQRRKNFELTRDEYFKMLQMKTGELFALSCDLGAYLSGASPADRSCLRQFGLAIGTAYQIYDDCLDLFGSEVSAGKSLGTDLATGKVTLPVLLLLEKADIRTQVIGLLQKWNPAEFEQLMGALADHQVMTESRQIVHGYLRTARQSVAVLPESDSRAGLLALTDYLGEQTDRLGQSNRSQLRP
jgi:octaprenyl-diphosphate synthase